MFLGMAASQPNKATTKLVNDSGEEGERVLREARLAREKEEEECTSERKDKGKGRSSTQ